MSFSDVLILVVRWLHALAAVAWVGGGIFYLLVVRPAQKRSQNNPESLIGAMGQEFRALVNTAMGILLITGTVLAVNRLTSDFVGVPYMTILSLKIALALYMFYLVRFPRRRTYPEDQPITPKGFRRVITLLSSTTAILVLGVIVFLLSDILAALFEKGLKG